MVLFDFTQHPAGYSLHRFSCFSFQLVIMFTSKNKSVDLTHFESKSSGIDSGDEINISENSSNSGEISDGNRSIAIIGSGDFGRALALRMVQSGLTVNIGSRNPQRNR